MHQWILEAMDGMEPWFLLSNVRLVFADQLITNDLLVQLGIKEMCLLHGDPCHLLNKVFPETFGNKHDSLFPHLQIMTNGTRVDWEAAFQNASRLLVGFPLHLESLESIHNKPSHCCKWHLNDLVHRKHAWTGGALRPGEKKSSRRIWQWTPSRFFAAQLRHHFARQREHNRTAATVGWAPGQHVLDRIQTRM
jgi:hypothetical protein